MFYGLLLPQILLQIYCIVHVLQNGKDKIWIFVILFLPYIGGVLYLFQEVLPSGRSRNITPNTQNPINTIENIFFPTKKIQQLEHQLALADTYQNRLLLGEAYAAAGRYPEAIELFTKALSGLYKDDPTALSKRALTHYVSENLQAAKKDFEHVLNTGGKLAERELLIYAIVLEKLHDATAEKAFQKAVHAATGLEAEYRYGLFLKNAGREEEARKIFEYMILKFKSSPAYFRRLESKWSNLAKQELQPVAAAQ